MLSGCEINSRILVKRETAKVLNSSSVARNDPGLGSINLFVIVYSSLSRSPIAVTRCSVTASQSGVPRRVWWIGDGYGSTIPFSKV